jgi:hypothetical protein
VPFVAKLCPQVAKEIADYERCCATPDKALLAKSNEAIPRRGRSNLAKIHDLIKQRAMLIGLRLEKPE